MYRPDCSRNALAVLGSNRVYTSAICSAFRSKLLNLFNFLVKPTLQLLRDFYGEYRLYFHFSNDRASRRPMYALAKFPFVCQAIFFPLRYSVALTEDSN